MKKLLMIISAVYLAIMVYQKLYRVNDYPSIISDYIVSLRHNDSVYIYDVKGFYKDKKYYFSLNDFYQIILTFDEDAKLLCHQKNHQLCYRMRGKRYVFDCKKGIIQTENEQIYVREYGDDIYFSRKNMYLSICFIEKIMLKDEFEIKISNKTAIIE